MPRNSLGTDASEQVHQALNLTLPFREKKKKWVAGEIWTSAIPPSDTLGTALDCCRIVAVRQKFVYFCLRERKKALVIVP